MKKEKKAMFSHNSDEWHTPKWLFDALNKEFRFSLDAAATPENALVKKFYTKEMNGLEKPWPKGKWTFCNPPYSLCAEFAKKAYEESQGGGILHSACAGESRDEMVLQLRSWQSAGPILSGARSILGQRISAFSLRRIGIREGTEYRSVL